MRQPRQQQEDPLNLRSLPLVAPPQDGWPAIESALQKNSRRQTILRYAGGALAAAAAVTLVVGLFLRQPPSAPASPVAMTPELAHNSAATDSSPEETNSSQTLDSLIAVSQQLESRVRAYRSGAGNIPAGALIYQVELEDLVAQVDDALSMNPDSLKLWSQRVNLMLDLSQLYENQLRRDYRQMASL